MTKLLTCLINTANFTDQPYFLLIKDALTFTLTGIGIWIAGSGLYTWRKQIKGGREFEVAYNLNLAVLKLRDAIKHVRNPAIWNAESNKAIQYIKTKYPDRNIVEDKDINSSIFVYEMRWEEITNAYTEMESHLLAAEVMWGCEIINKVRPLKKKVTELNISLQQYLVPEFRTSRSKDLFDIVYDTSNENKQDVFSQEVDQAVGTITNFLKPKIE